MTGSANVAISTGSNILSLHPASVYAGGANGFTLTVNGSGFVLSNPGPGSTLLINGSARVDQANIHCPTLILLGDQDGVTPLSMARALAGAVAKCTIKIIPATAHLTMAERPELFNAALVEFLAQP